MTGCEASRPPARVGTARILGTQTLVVLAGNVFTLVVGWPLQIYVARRLGSAGFGIFGLLDGGVATISVFLNLGITQTIVRYLPAHLERGEYQSVRAGLRLGTLMLLGLGLGSYLLLVMGYPLALRLWPTLKTLPFVYVVMGTMLPLTLLSSFLLQSLRGMHEIRYLVTGNSVLQLAVKATLTVILFAMGLRLLGYVIATVIATVVAISWMAIGLWRKVSLLPPGETGVGNLCVWRHYAGISYATSLLVGSVANTDRFAIGFFAGVAAVGVLTAIRQLQLLPTAFNQMLLMVGTPMLSAAHARGDAGARQHLYALMTDWVVRASLPLVIFLLLFSRPVLGLYGHGFAEQGAVALQIFVATQFFGIACGPVGNVALMSGLEKATLRMTMVQGLADAGLLIGLVPFMGIMGAAITSAITTVGLNLAVIVLVKRHLALRWWDERFTRWMLPAAGALTTGLVVALRGIATGPFALGGTLLLMYASFFALTLLSGLHEDDLDLVRHIHSRLFAATPSPLA